MSRTRIIVASALALGAAILATAPVVAGPPPAAQKVEPRWALSWEAAMAEAKERNVPIFISFHQDG